jgi:hypothetical protein
VVDEVSHCGVKINAFALSNVPELFLMIL